MSLRERLETIRSSPAPSNEEAAKLRILTPILQSLGWDPFGQEVLWEHPVDGKGGGGRVDIALKSAGRIVAFIEAKSPSTNLNNHVEQVLRYAFHEGVKICVLTTGLEWWLYLPREEGPPQERRFSILKLMDDPLDQLLEDLSAFLSRETLMSGQAESLAKAVREASLEAAKLNTEVPKIWEEMLSGPDDELVELLGKRVYQRLNLRPKKDQLVAILKGKDNPPVPTPAYIVTDISSQKEPELAPKVNQNDKPHTIVLWGQKYSISTCADAFRIVIDQLYARHSHEFHRVEELGSQSHRYAARDLNQLSQSGQDRNYEPRSSGYFFNIAWNPKNLEKRWGEYLNLFGYAADEATLLYD